MMAELNENRPSLPLGWRRKVVKSAISDRFYVYIFSPEGKRFTCKKELLSFFENNKELKLTVDQFSFRLTSDELDQKRRLTKLKSPKTKSQKTIKRKNDRCVNSYRRILPKGNFFPHLSLIPAIQAVRIIQPETYFIITSKCKFGHCVSYTENCVHYTVFSVAYTANFRLF